MTQSQTQAQRDMQNKPATHTPGPWRIAGKGTIRAGNDWIATVHWRNREANARVLAAVPDMLAALRAVVSVADRRTVEFDAARAAIAKAEGREP